MKKNKLHILYITCDWENIFKNNNRKFTEKLIRDRMDHDINSFSYFAWSKEDYVGNTGNISVLYKKPFFHSQPLLHLLSIFYIPFYIKKGAIKPDAVIVSDPGFLFAGYMVCKITGAKLISYLPHMPSVSAQTRTLGSIRELYVDTVEKLFYPLVDMFYVINQSVLSYLVNKGFPKNKIIPFTLDIFDRDSSYISLVKKDRIRLQYGLQNKKIILSVARFEKEKGHLELLKLFSKLDTNYVLILVGEGSLKKECEEYVKNKKIEGRVIFTGFINRDKIWNYYVDTDVFILLSKAEALGLVFWEAMYMGIPVIGSEAPGILETIGAKNERGIILRQPILENDFIQAIHKSLKKNEEQRITIENARRYVLEKIKNKRTFLQNYNEFFT